MVDLCHAYYHRRRRAHRHSESCSRCGGPGTRSRGRGEAARRSRGDRTYGAADADSQAPWPRLDRNRRARRAADDSRRSRGARARSPVIVADTTVAVAAALRWHEDHQLAARALAGRRTRLIAHVGLETYSVLTRLPPMHRVTPASAYEFIAGTFAATPVVLTPAGYDELLVIAGREQMIGGPG